MKRVHLFVHGRGQGHATRMLAIGRTLLDDGFEIRASAGESAYPILAAALPTRAVHALPPQPVAALRTLVPRTRRDIEALRAQRPSIIISDGDLPGLLAAKRLRIPTIAVGHGLVFWVCAPPHGIDRRAWRREALKARISAGLADTHVAVNFMPLSLREETAILARPSLDLPRRISAIPGKVVVYFRDPPPKPVLEALLGFGKRLCLYSRHDPGIPGIELRPPGRPDFVADLVEAEAVIGSAGSQLISECCALGIPFFGIYGAGDDEQALNIAMLRASRHGDGVAVEAFQPEHLEAFFRNPPRPLDPETSSLPDVASVIRTLCRRAVGPDTSV